MVGKKIAIVFGKGLDGCGVEKFGYEWQRYDPENIDVFALKERAFNRGGTHISDYIEFKPDEMSTIAERLNKDYDIVIINSYPSPMHSQKTVTSFYRDLILKIEKPILVSMMHEIIQSNYDRIPLQVAISNAADVVFNFSTHTNYAKDMARILTNKKLGERIARMKLPLTLDDFQKWRITHDQKKRRCIYAGRWSSMKQPNVIIELWERDKDFHYALHGIEKSIGAKYDVIDPCDYFRKYTGTYNYDSERCECFGEFDYNQGMTLISESMFGYSGFHLPKMPHNYGDRFEYAQMEIIACGTVPIFDMHYGNHNRAVDGSLFADHPIAIWNDRTNLDMTIDLIHTVADDHTTYYQYNEDGLEFLHQEAESSVVIPHMIRHICIMGKQEDKWNTQDLLREVYKTEEVYDEFNYLLDNKITALGVKEIDNGDLSYFEKKARLVHKNVSELNTQSLEDFFG